MKSALDNETARKTLIGCILRQLQKMGIEELREAYNAVSKVSDRRRKNVL